MDYDLLLINVSRDQSGLSGAFKDSIGQYLIASYLRQRDFKAFVWSGDAGACKRILEREIGGGRTAIAGFYAAADNIRWWTGRPGLRRSRRLSCAMTGRGC